MTYVLIVLCVVLGIIAFGALFYIGYSINKNKWRDIHFDDLKKEKEKLEWELAQEKAKEHEINPEQLKWYEEKVKSFENRISDLNQRIEEKQDEIKRYNDIIKELNSKNVKLGIAYTSLESTVTATREEFDKLTQAKFETLELQKGLDEAIQASKTAAQNCERDVVNLKKEIEDLKELKRLALLYQDESKEGLCEFSIAPKENELISILERIKMDYPELKMDISSIEWRKIWLPKAQDMANEHDLAHAGIYRLVLKEDENVCYVGQAVNIKDRWYQHIKKMIGVDVKGNEKLYNYRPEDFYWTVVELIPQYMLNEREHYWIEFFGCKEKGLNRKA